MCKIQLIPKKPRQFKIAIGYNSQNDRSLGIFFTESPNLFRKYILFFPMFSLGFSSLPRKLKKDNQQTIYVTDDT